MTHKRNFMSKHMLIDAAHPEQTRVAVVNGNRVEDFDFESRSKKQLRGNIYLAKVTRVEASLQAAFVEYGGNRHGFLSFNEIHPDYYQIPVRDREKLLKLEEEEELAAERAEAKRLETQNTDMASEAEEDQAQDLGEDALAGEESELHDDDTDAAEEAAIAEEAAARRRQNRTRSFRRYKIQEVIKPGQVLLVQVSKEERGTKGAALTTYLSLAGRYCVLMPNTARGGGVSRKISNAADRKRLKSIIADLGLPKGVGLIIRTAGSKRTKVEIRRDYEYLGRLWDLIREKTLSSIAPTLVHEEGGLVRRAVRDLYDKDIEAVYVEGEDAYREAHAFMKMLMPSHASRVKHYKDAFPIFLKYQVEEQLEAIYHPNVRLKSGGYLVIHQTEALVAIDVNSGRSTKERNIEATALKTNLEAADEACRQMRLRDLAGLVVIDFIDMDENKNNRAVEKRMKEALKRDRARIQMGRISAFGLMELSRQRRRASVIEGSSQVCPTCAGLGVVRSVESAALSALQGIEAEAMKGRLKRARLTAPTAVALYLLNEKRDFIANMENALDIHLVIDASAELMPPHFEIEVLERHKGGARAERKAAPQKSTKELPAPEQTGQETANEIAQQAPQPGEDKAEGLKKRRRGRRGGRGRRKNAAEVVVVAEQTGAVETIADVPGEESASSVEPAPAKAGTTRRKRRRTPKAEKASTEAPTETTAEAPAPEAADQVSTKSESPEAKRPVRRRRSARSKTTEAKAPATKPQMAVEETVQSSAPAPETPVSGSEGETEKADNAKPAASKGRPVRRRRARTAKAAAPESGAESGAESAAQPKAPAKPSRKRAAAASVPPETAKAPKPRRRPARRKTAKAQAAGADTQPQEAGSEVEASAPAAPATAEAAQEPESSGKTKKGWWARNFSS